jgi:uncharacterized membrane protein YbhN (UPF0104 family)
VRLIGTILAILLMVYLLSRQGWNEIGEAIVRIEIWRFVLAFGLIMVARLAVTGRWYVLLRSGGIRVSFAQTLRLTLAGLFATNFLPSTVGGDVVRLAGAVQLGFDGAVSTASLVMDRLVGMMGMALILPVGVLGLLQPGTLTTFSRPSGSEYSAGMTAFTLTSWGPKLWERLRSLLLRTLEALKVWIRQPTALFGALLFTFIHMVCLFGSMTVLLTGMGESVVIWLVGGVWSLVYFITLLPVSINGLGIQEVSIAFIFSNFAGVSESNGLILALLVRTLLMLSSLPGALFLPGILPGVKKDKNHASQVD